MFLQKLSRFAKYSQTWSTRISGIVIATATLMIIFGVYIMLYNRASCQYSFNKYLRSDIRSLQNERNVFKRYYDEQHSEYLNQANVEGEQENSRNMVMSVDKLAFEHEVDVQPKVANEFGSGGLFAPKRSTQELSRWLKWMANPSIDVNNKCKVAAKKQLLLT